MFSTKRIASSKSASYATGADFCRIFQTDMNHLFLLSYLLTADSSTAELCFVQGLEDARNGSPVFKEWAHSWARRLLVVNAIRMLRPRPESSHTLSASSHIANNAIPLPAGIASILALNTFDRFAFAMSVLEGYSDRECSLLLECSISDLVAARTRALQQIGNPADLRHEVAAIDSGKPLLSPDVAAAIGPAVVPSQLAASA